MEDLLNEEEFLQKPVKPWKWFALFYILNAISFLAYFIIASKNGDISVFSGAIMMCGIPLLSVFIMVFSHKNYKMIPIKTIALSIIMMMLLHYLYSDIITLVFGYYFDSAKAIGGLCLYTLMAIMCMAIILPIIRRKQKKHNIRFTFN